MAGDELLDPAADDVDARDQRLDVADDLGGRAAVAGDDAEHVVGRGPRPVEADGRQQQALEECVGGQGGQSPRRHAAHVGHVDQGAAEPRHPPGHEDGAEHEDVVGVDAAAVGVVEGEHVARFHGVEADVIEQGGEGAAQAGAVHEAGGV